AGAVREPAGLPGRATVTATMRQQGAGRRGALEIADEVALVGAQLGTGASLDVATVSLDVPKRRLEPALDLLADVLLRPTFPDSEVTRQRELRRAQIVQQADNPAAIASIAFPAIVYGRMHPYGRPLHRTEAPAGRLTRDRRAARSGRGGGAIPAAQGARSGPPSRPARCPNSASGCAAAAAGRCPRTGSRRRRRTARSGSRATSRPPPAPRPGSESCSCTGCRATTSSTTPSASTP